MCLSEAKFHATHPSLHAFPVCVCTVEPAKKETTVKPLFRVSLSAIM